MIADGAIWLAGCGNMGGAMLSRWLATGLDPARVTVIRPSGRGVADGVRVVRSPPAGELPPALLMLALKPQALEGAAPALGAAIGGETTVLSILAGTSLASLAHRFPSARAIVRAMPNTPVAIGEGVVTMTASDGSTETDRADLDRLMAPLGLVQWLDGEAALDDATALTGCGPAFLFRFVDALAAAGTTRGLDPVLSGRLALATVAGAAALARRAGETPARLAERVASPGGATRAGLDVLDRDDALARLLDDTLAAARRRTAELASLAR